MLDEPVNHLDIPSRTNFERALVAFPGSVLASTHDRFFIRAFASSIWAIAGNRVLRKEAPNPE